MSKFILVRTAIASLALAGAASVCAQERPTLLYNTLTGATTPLAANEPFALATTVPPTANARSQYVVVAKANSLRLCLRACRTETFIEVDAWNDTTAALVPTSASGTTSVSGGVAAVSAAGLDSGRVVTAEVDGDGVLSIRTWTVGASGVVLQNGYSTAAESALPAVAIATLNSTEVVTAYALPNGTLAVEEWTISAEGLPSPVATVGYQNGDVTGNEVLPPQNGLFANQVSIATVNPTQVVTAIGDTAQSMWLSTWSINNGVQAQTLQQIPDTVGTFPQSIAVGAGQSSVFVPGIGLRPGHYETVQSAFTPFINSAKEMNVLYWTIATTGQLTEQPTFTPTGAGSTGFIGVAATMLPTNVAMTSYDVALPAYGQVEEFYHGYLGGVGYDPWQTFLGGTAGSPPAVIGVGWAPIAPVGSAAEGNDPPSLFDPYNAYFVTASEELSLNLLNINVFSYPLPPTEVGFR